ncbi:ATP-binding protein [Actinoplanes sp. CA-252034]|uniref:ATP-binding protein n=1 Tax=Actinoplanes sp. CA-252034 TaxID=3239906 RepID=UPI003D97B7C7
MPLNASDTAPEGAGHTAHALVESLPPLPGAPRHARDLVTEACVRWDLGHLTGPATLITSELVSNVLDHAHTTMTLHIALRPACLYLAVEDGSASPPAPVRHPSTGPAGRGLHLVEAVSTTWGYSLGAGGKTVWATLSLPHP